MIYSKHCNDYVMTAQEAYEAMMRYKESPEGRSRNKAAEDKFRRDWGE